MLGTIGLVALIIGGSLVGIVVIGVLFVALGNVAYSICKKLGIL